MPYNKVQDCAHRGTDGADGAPGGHPMHNHVCHQQICGTGVSCTGRCGLAMEYCGFVDSVRISFTSIEPCYTRFKTVNYSRKVMCHCHDLMHEDYRMIGWVNKVGGPDNLPLQDQASCDAVRKQAKGKKGNGKSKWKGKTGVVG